MLSDEELLRLYQDKSFTGSYSGVSNFRHFIFTDFGELIPYNRIYKLLHTLPSYVYQLRSPRHFKTRSYQVDSFGKLMGKKIFSEKVRLILGLVADYIELTIATKSSFYIIVRILLCSSAMQHTSSCSVS